MNMMKFLCIPFILILLSPQEVLSQNLTFSETVDYLNEKLQEEEILSQWIEVNKNGTIKVVTENFIRGATPSSSEFKFQNVNVNNVTRSDADEIGKWGVLVECKNGNCVKYRYNARSDLKRFPGYTFYFNDRENAVRFRKALVHLKSKANQYKDPFD
jgi:hypothetical protein